ncbi:MAG: SIS domain-containing protein [Bacteroidetes bacterium]|nr:MAG: SIS domain-containing protein [Bacteroidota bacterium]
MQKQISAAISASIETKQQILTNSEMLNAMAKVSQMLADAFGNGNRVFFCGNGGSAADAQHLAAELTGPFYNRSRPALPAEALHCNTSYLTAAANDYDYSEVYARLVNGIMQPGDILFGLTTSGNSSNVVKAFEAAQHKGVVTIGMTGLQGGKLKPLSHVIFDVPSTVTPRIQEAHILIGHIICELVESIMFPSMQDETIVQP